MRTSWLALPSVVLLSSLGACGPSKAPVRPAVPGRASPVAAKSPPVIRPARWFLQPAHGGPMFVRVDLTPRGTLLTGSGGERWLQHEEPGRKLDFAPHLLAGAVVGVARIEGRSDALSFVLDDGRVQLASPLGPILETRSAPNRPARAVAVGRGAIVGLTEGNLLRSTDGGRSYGKVALPPTATGIPVDLAMSASGDGLILLAPQRVLATTDDGESWQLVPTPGIGARRVGVNVNGDLYLEGLVGTAILRRSPLRLEKAAIGTANDFTLPGETPDLGLAEALDVSRAALVGTRYHELLGTAEGTWTLWSGELAGPKSERAMPQLTGCDAAFVAGAAEHLFLACDVSEKGKGDGDTQPGGREGSGPGVLRIFHSTDGGATFREEPAIVSSSRDKRLWVAADGTLIVDGACKRARSDYSCEDSPPVVRAPVRSVGAPAVSGAAAGGSTSASVAPARQGGSPTAGAAAAVASSSGPTMTARPVAKVLSAPSIHFSTLAFDPRSPRALAVGEDGSGRAAAFVSHDGGRDFVRAQLPPVVLKESHEPLLPNAEGSTASFVGKNWVVIAFGVGGGREAWLRYESRDGGASFDGAPLSLESDAVSLYGERGLAYDSRTQKAYETLDGGLTFHSATAPVAWAVGRPRMIVVCQEIGCFLGRRGIRLGWDEPTTPSIDAPKPMTRGDAANEPLRCKTVGPARSIAGAEGLNVGNADLANDSDWVIASRNGATGATVALVGRVSERGVTVSAESLFPESSVNSASTVSMQIEGVAAMRYAFRRESNPAPTPAPTAKAASPTSISARAAMLARSGPIPRQTVDVEVAWYLAQTGKVYRGKIPAAGSIEATRDILERGTAAAQARPTLLSIAHGGLHVAPFAKGSSATDVPLFFVRTDGRWERMTMPVFPSEDVAGRALRLHLDAARVGTRSVIFGEAEPGVQLLMAWSPEKRGEAASSWETKVWGVWPAADKSSSSEGLLRFLDSGEKPVMGVLRVTDERVALWATPFETASTDPAPAFPVDVQSALGWPLRACPSEGSYPLRSVVALPDSRTSPLQLDVDGRPVELHVHNAVVRAERSGNNACVTSLDAWSERTAKGGAPEYAALLHLRGRRRGSLFQMTGDKLTVQALECGR